MCKEARDLFGRAAGAAPDNSHVLQAWAVFEKQQGNLDGAHNLFERAVALDPRDAYVIQAWAVLERSRKQWQLAKSSFEDAASLERKPKSRAWCYWDRAKLANETGRGLEAAREALPFLEKSVEAFPMAEVLRELASVCDVLGLHDESVRYASLARSAPTSRQR